MTVHIWNFDKDIKIEGKNFYMPSGKLKIGSTAHVEVIKKTTKNNISQTLIKYIYMQKIHMKKIINIQLTNVKK